VSHDVAIGSLFSGIGGLDLGLECALRDGGFNVSTVWQCEADAWCRGILARHWPHAVQYDDVRAVGPDAPRVDVLCGGFPCQDVSIAGRGDGLAGARSGLWYQFSRIIRDLRPRVVVVENVAALVSRGLGEVLRELSQSGYDALWFPLRASDVGAPHQRERLFVVAQLADTGGCESGARPPADVQWGRAFDAEQTGVGGRRAGATTPDAPRLAQSGVGREPDGLSGGLDLAAHRWPARPGVVPPATEPRRVVRESDGDEARLIALGNAVVPQCGYVVGCVVAEVLRGGVA